MAQQSLGDRVIDSISMKDTRQKISNAARNASDMVRDTVRKYTGGPKPPATARSSAPASRPASAKRKPASRKMQAKNRTSSSRASGR